MTGASEDLLQAVYGLRKAAEAQFTGNDYYQVANEIAVLIELLGWGDGPVPVGQGASYGFATMLDEVRKLARASTSGSQYNVIVHKLDGLASYVSPAASVPAPAAPVSEKPAAAATPAPAPVAAPVEVPASVPAPTPSAAKPTFDDLAAASKARVEEVAVSLGIGAAHHAAPSHQEAEAAPAAGPSEQLLQALYGLRKAAEAQFTSNAYYQVANEINGLIELMGSGDGRVPAGQDAAYGFATMLDEVRKLAETGTSRNQYFAIVCKLDLLASYVTPAAPASEKPAAAVAPAVHAAEAAPADEVPERRSSEPCSMAELALMAAEPVDHAHDGAGDAAKCPFHAVFADTAEVPAAEPTLEAAAAPMPTDHVHDEAGDAVECPFHAKFADTAEALAAEPAPAHEEPAPASSENVASFDDLAAASKARVELAAESLDVAPAHHAAPSQPEAEVVAVVIETIAVAESAPAPEAAPSQPEAEAVVAVAAAEPAPAAHPSAPSQAEAAEAPSEWRLESRSSSAVGQCLESAEPAAIPGQTAPEPDTAEAAPDLGSPAAQSEAPAVEEIVALEAPTAEIAVEPAVAAAPAPEAVAPTAVQKIEVIKPAETKRKEPKTLFKLWLDLAFGRKD